MTNATITRLHDAQWAFAMRIGNVDSETFHLFLDAMKQAIPHRARKWDSQSKSWLFTVGCIDTVEYLLDRHGLTYDFDNDTSGRHELMSRSQAAAKLYLLPTAPPEVVNAVYRTLAKQYHPDLGGDLAKMQRLNSALEVLR